MLSGSRCSICTSNCDKLNFVRTPRLSQKDSHHIRLLNFADMPMGQGRVGLFLLFSFYLEVLDRILVLRCLEPAG